MSAIEWRACRSFPDYEVSECGDVRRSAVVATQPRRRLRGFIDADGYVRYSLHGLDGKSHPRAAHQLVAKAFIGPRPSPDHEVAHNNGSRLGNTPANLRWALQAENEADRADHGTRPVGEKNPRATITDEDVRYIRRRYREIKETRGKVSELDAQFGLCRGQIIKIARGQSWSHVL
jgi:hypothetical protein